jgi:antitoxin (DNA-binding transcriptional repressor) of toxin-antitoxin stability system
MSRQVNLYEAKTSLSRLVDEAAGGETIVIAKGGRPMARLGPIDADLEGPRKLGQLSARAKGVDWIQWWRDWKAADREIEAAFDASGRAPLPRARRRRRPRAR